MHSNRQSWGKQKEKKKKRQIKSTFFSFSHKNENVKKKKNGLRCYSRLINRRFREEEEKKNGKMYIHKLGVDGVRVPPGGGRECSVLAIYSAGGPSPPLPSWFSGSRLFERFSEAKLKTSRCLLRQEVVRLRPSQLNTRKEKERKTNNPSSNCI